MRITINTLRTKLYHVNEVVLSNSIYQLELNRNAVYYALYLHLKKDNRRIRGLYFGDNKEIYAFLDSLQQRFWYMTEPF